MKYRKLRIAWSVVWAIIVLLCVALWVRSYFTLDITNWYLTKEQGIHLASSDGVATIDYFDDASKGFIGLDVPYWCVTLVAAILTAIPWMRARFSLRTLLIAVTLIAVFLGLVTLLK